MSSNVYKEPETVAAHYYLFLGLFQCRLAYDRELLLSLLETVKRTSVFHTQNPSVFPAWIESLWKLTTCRTNQISCDFAAIWCILTKGTSRLFLQKQKVFRQHSYQKCATNSSWQWLSWFHFTFVFLLLLHFNSLWKNANHCLPNSLFVYLQYLCWFLFYIILMYAFWKQTEQTWQTQGFQPYSTSLTYKM